MLLTAMYESICCDSCSQMSIACGNRWLRRWKGYVLTKGVRLTNDVTQKRVLKTWRRLHGPIDYTNGYREHLLEMKSGTKESGP